MRALDRLISFVFSVIMLVLSIILILVGVGGVNPQMIIDMLNEHVFVNEVIKANTFNAITITGIILFLASLKTTVFLSLFRVKDKSPILVKTQNGEVEIAQETIIGTVKSIGTSFDSIKDVQAKMVKKGKGIIIYAVVMVYENSNIREITDEMQKQIKEVLHSTTGINVTEVNIKVKNVCQKQRKNEGTHKIVRKEDNEEPQNSQNNEIQEEVQNVEEGEVQASTEQDLNQISMEDVTQNNE